MHKVLIALAILIGYSAFTLPVTASADASSTEVHALNLQFDQSTITVAAGSSVSITLDNDENYIAHNLSVDVPGVDATKACLGKCTATLTFTAPDPGYYHFFCTLHPDTMTGDLIVQ